MMLREHVLKLLRDIDSVEASMRGLESRLTSIRVQLRRELLHDREADYVPESEQKVQK